MGGASVSVYSRANPVALVDQEKTTWSGEELTVKPGREMTVATVVTELSARSGSATVVVTVAWLVNVPVLLGVTTTESVAFAPVISAPKSPVTIPLLNAAEP